MDLEDLRIYQQSMDFGEKIWNKVITWDRLAIDTFGKQLIRSSDSIAANISEGFGRYHLKEIKHFCYIARGSLFESKTWITKAKNRKLIALSDFEEFVKELKDLGIKLNNYIKSLDKNIGNQIKEDPENYGNSNTDLSTFMDYN